MILHTVREGSRLKNMLWAHEQQAAASAAWPIKQKGIDVHQIHQSALFSWSALMIPLPYLCMNCIAQIATPNAARNMTALKTASFSSVLRKQCPCSFCTKG